MSTRTRKRPTATKARKTRTMVPFAKRENTSTIAMYPLQCAQELLVSEREIRVQMAIGVERGGLRSIVLGNPDSARPRRIVHREDFALWLEYKRGRVTLAEYVRKAGGKA
jgi:hypothetical protein